MTTQQWLPSALAFLKWLSTWDWVLIVSTATLGAVGYQIYLARREVKYVREDLERNKIQFEEFMRKPIYRVAMEVVSWCEIQSRQLTFEVRLFVYNEGSRPSRAFALELLLPWRHKVIFGTGPMREEFRPVGSTLYIVSVLPYDKRTLYQGSSPAYLAYNFAYERGTGSVTFYYRIIDDYGATPENEYYEGTFVVP